MGPPTTLLSTDALRGVQVGISVSESPDLARLGLLETHLRLAVAEITRTVVSAGGGLIYGGHLQPAGYTAFMLTELQRYARRDRPLLVCLAWSEHRRLSLPELADFEQRLSLFGRLVCLDQSGAEVDPSEGRGVEPDGAMEPGVSRQALTSMRQYMRDRQTGRVLIGGKREDYSGRMPGLMEEALLALNARQPIYLAGGFGGVTADIARALGVDDASWLPSTMIESDDPGYTHGYSRLAELTRTPEWEGLDNGLSHEENRRLAASHRPSDIATMVSLGLGRRTQ